MRSRNEHPVEYILREGTFTEDGCLIPPQKPRLSDGYALVGSQNKMVLAHRLVWEHHHGPVPEGLEVRHVVCANRRCCNIDHLAIGTRSDNMQDAVRDGTHGQARKTHCKHGHEFTPENTYLGGGGRYCRECHRDRERSRRSRFSS